MFKTYYRGWTLFSRVFPHVNAFFCSHEFVKKLVTCTWVHMEGWQIGDAHLTHSGRFFFAEWNYGSKHPIQFQKHLFWLGPLKGLRFWQILFNRISVNTIGSLSLIIGTTNIFETVYFFILICLDGALNRSRKSNTVTESGFTGFL